MRLYSNHAMIIISVNKFWFLGEYYYNLNGDTPRKALSINKNFRGVPAQLDAVLSFHGNIYFFKVTKNYILHI